MSEANDVLSRIIRLEWAMFGAVNEGGPRASCQEDYDTFAGMRRAQFGAWPIQAARSYLNDLTAADAAGRNLVAEKYIHMMRTAAPSGYEALVKTIPAPSDEVRALARLICDRMLEDTAALHRAYPYLSGSGRPLYSAQDQGGTSIETYQLGELLTYSENTLRALKAHLDGQGGSLARRILENTVRHYGYPDLDAAEEAARRRAEEAGFTFSSGCGGDAP